MLTIDWAKIDKFYIALVFVLILMAILVIFTFKSVFSAFNTAYEIDQGSAVTELKVDREKLEEAYGWVFNRGANPLKIKY
jgi:hypothetical protein